MNKLYLFLSVVLCLLHGLALAQKPGDIRWYLLIDPSIHLDTIRSIKVRPDGKIMAAGNSWRGTNMVIALGRYVDNQPDSSFGINGLLTTYLDSADAVANALELQTDGKMVIAGSYRKGTERDFLLMRYNPDGSIDSSFGINGVVRTNISPGTGCGTIDVATSLAIRTDGKIVAAGRWDSWLAVCRYNPDGSLDSSFDSDGILAEGAAGANAMKLQTDGKILLCCGGTVLRMQPDGTLDNSFGWYGSATLAADSYDIAIQKDGRILVAGESNNYFVVERLDTAGAPDTSFGTAGVVKTSGFDSPDRGQGARSVCVQPDGGILVAGYAKYGLVPINSYLAVARYLSNGKLDKSFGVNGKVAVYYFGLSSSTATPFSTAINNNGELLVAGTNNVERGNPSKWILVCYYLGLPLAIHPVSGGDGQVIVAPNPAEEFAQIQSAHIDNGSWRLSLSDLTGRTVYSESVLVTNSTLNKRISLNGLPAAMYVIKLDNGIRRMATILTKSK